MHFEYIDWVYECIDVFRIFSQIIINVRKNRAPIKLSRESMCIYLSSCVFF